MKKIIGIVIIIAFINILPELKADCVVYTIKNYTIKRLTVTISKKTHGKDLIKQDDFCVDEQQQKSRSLDGKTPIIIDVRFHDGTRAIKDLDFTVLKDNAPS